MSFKEKNIRPENLMKKANIFFKKDLKYLYSKKKKFIKVNCPACNSKNKKFLFKKNKLSYYECNHCKTFYLSPRPTEKILSNFYMKSQLYEYWNNVIFPNTEKVRFNKIFKPRVQKIINICKKYKIQKKKIIDIGAGYGTFCYAMKKIKYFGDVIAIEPNVQGAKKCLEKNIKTINSTIENVEKKELKNVSLVTLFEVIEHLYSPYKFLKSIKKLINKKTFIIFTCPNGMGFDISFLGKKSEAIDHEHLNYFNPISIRKLANRAGYSIVDVITPGVLDVDILFNKYKSGVFKTNNNFLKQIFNDENKIKNLQKFIIKNELSSNMWVVLKQK